MKALSLVVAALGLSVVAACSSSPAPLGPRLELPGHPEPVSAVVPDVPPHTPYVFSVFAVCVANGKSVTPTGVSVADPIGKLEILEWGVRRRFPGDPYSAGDGTDDPGAMPGRLSTLTGFTHGPVTVSCSDQVNADEFDVSVQSATPVATAGALLVHYRLGGEGKTVRMPYSITMCSAPKCPTAPADH